LLIIFQAGDLNSDLILDREVIERVSLAEDTVRGIYLTSHLAQSA
jgi:hypothetical protein